MTGIEVALKVIDALESFSLPYMLVDSFSTNAHGIPRSTKDLDDVENVLAVKSGRLDLSYIRHWCDQHGTRDIFKKLLADTQEISEGKK